MAKRPEHAEEDDGWPILELWKEYEKIAMHFNDLIIRIRTQALGGVAALSALTGIFAKADLGPLSYSWQVAGLVFLALAAFWLAIWIIGFRYYNKLLIGSIAALLALEKRSETHKTINAIQLSTMVEDSVKTGIDFKFSCSEKLRIAGPRWAFYSIVMLALLLGFSFSVCTSCHLIRDVYSGINH
jgi:hypothetical protein